MSRYSQLFTLVGMGMIAFSNCIYLVEPGEKALIMNNLTGLKQIVYNQGYNFKIPFIEVRLPSNRPKSSTMYD